MIEKRLRKIIWQVLLIICILKKNKYVLLISQKLIRIVKKQVILLMIPNKEKERGHHLTVKELPALLHGKT